MIQPQAEQVVMDFTKPVFAFAKSRCATIEDAEDIAQEICIKLYRALLHRNDIAEPVKFAWTIAHNVLANYYRGRWRQGINMPIHEVEGTLPASGDITLAIEEAETTDRLYREIAYLSKTRRQIVTMYYFENKRQQQIAAILDLSVGTVKWYLSDAKTELQKGLEKMRTSELKFNPIKFDDISTVGSAGSMGGNQEILRSALSQNILYLTRSTAMTINNMADALGVSPVYVESEVEFLEHNAFMLKQGKGYIANVLIDSPTTESNRLTSEVYDKAAEMLAPELFDALAAEIKCNNDGVYNGFTIEVVQTAPSKGQGVFTAEMDDINFAMWALVPYLIAQSGKPGNAISFEEAATIRPDGGVNICHCFVKNDDAEPIKYSESLRKMGGPAWNGNNKFILWLMDTVWGGNRTENYYPGLLERDLSSLTALFEEGLISQDDAIRMTERGYFSRTIVPEGETVITPGATVGLTEDGGVYAKREKEGWFATATYPSGSTIDKLEIVWLTKEANERLLGIANTVREKYHAQFEKLKAMYHSADTPPHMKKARAYGIQNMFLSDGMLIIYVINKLLESGRLKLPAEQQRKSLSAVLVLL